MASVAVTCRRSTITRRVGRGCDLLRELGGTQVRRVLQCIRACYSAGADEQEHAGKSPHGLCMVTVV